MPPQREDLTGKKFGRLTVVRYDHMGKAGAYYLCKCDCGGTKVVTSGHLKSGKIQSCGCIRRERAKEMGINNRKPSIVENLPKYEHIRAMLCNKYERKCLTGKCPMREFNCYDYVNITDMWQDAGAIKRKKVVEMLTKLEKELTE